MTKSTRGKSKRDAPEDSSKESEKQQSSKSQENRRSSKRLQRPKNREGTQVSDEKFSSETQVSRNLKMV